MMIKNSAREYSTRCFYIAISKLQLIYYNKNYYNSSRLSHITFAKYRIGVTSNEHPSTLYPNF